MQLQITPQIQELIERRYPDLSPRQRGNRVREDLHKLYLKLCLDPPTVTAAPEPTLVLLENPRDIANRVAEQAPAIDDGNWSLIASSVQEAIDVKRWDTAIDVPRLLVELHKPFVDAKNEFRVQHSRIKAFFDRHLW